MGMWSAFATSESRTSLNKRKLKKPHLHKRTLLVEAHHLDELNHVNNAIYVQWIQEIASEHWLQFHADPHPEGLFWVVLEHHIRYKSQAFLGDKLWVETYVEPPVGMRFPRMVNFKKDGQLVVEAKTLWCLIDSQSLRPRKIDASLIEDFFIKA